MKSALPKFVLNYKHVEVVAIVPVKNPEAGGRLAVDIRRESPGAKVKETEYGWSVIARLHPSDNAPTESKICFVKPNALVKRKDVIYEMNVYERGGRRLARGRRNFAQVICNSQGERLVPLWIDYSREDCGPRVLYAGNDMVAVNANDDDYACVSHLTLQEEEKVVCVNKEELRSALDYQDPLCPRGFYDAVVAAVERACCKGCAHPHFSKLWENTEFSERKKRKFMEEKRVSKGK